MNALTLPETTSGEYSFRYIDIGSVSEDGKVTLDEPIRFDEAPSRARRVVKRNDVLISTVRTYLKAIAPVDFDATDLVASTGFAVCTPTKGTHPRYLAYAVRSDGVIDEICKESCGISYPAINSTKLAGIEITYCDAELQRQIVAYLDEKFTAIDRKVALLEQKRTAYGKLKRALINETVTRGLDKNAELKDSGVDWIGKMPEGWAIMRIKDVACSVGSGGTPAAGNALFYADANGYNWVSISDMSNVEYVTKTEKLLTQAGVEDKQLTVFPPGTVLYSMYATIGRVSELAIPSTINQAILAITFSPKYCKGFIKYALKAFEPWAIAHTSESTQKNLNAEKVRRFFIAVPNAEEQRIIANYLDAKCARIDKVLVLVAKKIELYKKLKRSLIDEVVTGRRKVA